MSFDRRTYNRYKSFTFVFMIRFMFSLPSFFPSPQSPVCVGPLDMFMMIPAISFSKTRCHITSSSHVKFVFFTRIQRIRTTAWCQWETSAPGSDALPGFPGFHPPWMACALRPLMTWSVTFTVHCEPVVRQDPKIKKNNLMIQKSCSRWDMIVLFRYIFPWKSKDLLCKVLAISVKRGPKRYVATKSSWCTFLVLGPKRNALMSCTFKVLGPKKNMYWSWAGYPSTHKKTRLRTYVYFKNPHVQKKLVDPNIPLHACSRLLTLAHGISAMVMFLLGLLRTF